MLSLPVQEQFRRFIRPHLKQLMNELGHDAEFDVNRVTVWADVEAYKWKEDEFVWNQKRDNIPDIFQVFVDGIFICYLNENVPRKVTLKDFWRGFLKAYSLDNDDPGKLWLDESIYEDRANEKKRKRKKQEEEILKAIEDKPVNSKEQKIAKEIALDVAKESSSSS